MADVKAKAVKVEDDDSDEQGNEVGGLRLQGRFSTMHQQEQPQPQILSISKPPSSPRDNKTSREQFLFRKELKCSDVGTTGRIVIPKACAERHFPALTDRKTLFMLMDDMDTSEIWAFRYRFWRNNRSRMFVLERTGDFVKSRGLQSGDFIMFYKSFPSGRYGIRTNKKAVSGETLPPHEANSLGYNHQLAETDAKDETGTKSPPEDNLKISLGIQLAEAVVRDETGTNTPPEDNLKISLDMNLPGGSIQG